VSVLYQVPGLVRLPAFVRMSVLAAQERDPHHPSDPTRKVAAPAHVDNGVRRRSESFNGGTWALRRRRRRASALPIRPG